ncbi:histone H1-like [Pistacia vera]|uniref:histone H1-like n=1 Tax=Pistacia vera TaxID=55513 RepID=UPI001263C6B9|nr:histone H1-like [Pistacia vera]
MDASSFVHPQPPRPIPPSLPHQHHHAPPPPPPTSAIIANPTPPFLNHNNSHPPYTEMISSAITALKEKDGSSMRAIAKYIEKVYVNSLPLNHPALLSHHLKRLKNIGQLVMVKKSYKLARSPDVAFIVPPESNNFTPENATGISSAHGPKTG